MELQKDQTPSHDQDQSDNKNDLINTITHVLHDLGWTINGLFNRWCLSKDTFLSNLGYVYVSMIFAIVFLVSSYNNHPNQIETLKRDWIWFHLMIGSESLVRIWINLSLLLTTIWWLLIKSTWKLRGQALEQWKETLILILLIDISRIFCTHILRRIII